MKTLSELLEENGYDRHGKRAEILDFCERFLKKGHTDLAYILKRVRKRFGDPPSLMPWREEAMPLAEALEAGSPEEVVGLAKTKEKILEALRSPVVTRGALMPDACIAGSEFASLPVGGILEAKGALIPAAHSADICCSLRASFYQGDLSTSDELDRLTKVTRFGPGGRRPEDWLDHPVLHEDVWENPFLSGLQDHAAQHLADQGDGNHFCFLGTGNEARALVTHHGSRGLGAAVFKRGLAAAVKHTHVINGRIPESACWLDASSELGQLYWEALQYVARWTEANHELVHERFLVSIGSKADRVIANEHNFVWRKGDFYLHGKGATPAWPHADGSPRLGLIPLNMTEPILVVEGRDNADYLSFAPHGAGRYVSRTKLIRDLRKRKEASDPKYLDRLIEENTKGVEVRWFSGKPDLTETALGYKNADSIKQQIAHFRLAEVVEEIRPRGSLMAGRSKSWKELRAEHLSPKQLRQMEHRKERRRKKQDGYL